jgi:hypothetical protein
MYVAFSGLLQALDHVQCYEIGFSFVTLDMKCICLLVADIQEPGEVQE